MSPTSMLPKISRAQSILKERSLGALIKTKSFEIEFDIGVTNLFRGGEEYVCSAVLVSNVLCIDSFDEDFDFGF